ncbi:uncharacterized protein LOC112631928 [Theropithecus gelada]|uniref:uncharacterized protein LOC112631928 n=1 Tax=Theropithecus gelada TaxID=9565 RepID=UPI000DC1A4E5|nr:uncharacterized protein LOC112631928 [Theropithecus gelada]
MPPATGGPLPPELATGPLPAATNDGAKTLTASHHPPPDLVQSPEKEALGVSDASVNTYTSAMDQLLPSHTTMQHVAHAETPMVTSRVQTLLTMEQRPRAALSLGKSRRKWQVTSPVAERRTAMQQHLYAT